MSIYMATLAADKTDEAVITPTSGKKLCIVRVFMENPETTDPSATLKFGSTVHYEAEPGSTMSTDQFACGDADQSLLLTGKIGVKVRVQYEETT
jgi:hypothetical protein